VQSEGGKRTSSDWYELYSFRYIQPKELVFQLGSQQQNLVLDQQRPGISKLHKRATCKKA